MGRSECGGKGGGEECYAGEAQAGGVLHGASEHGFGVGRLREHEAEKPPEQRENIRKYSMLFRLFDAAGDEEEYCRKCQETQFHRPIERVPRPN